MFIDFPRGYKQMEKLAFSVFEDGYLDKQSMFCCGITSPAPLRVFGPRFEGGP